MIFCITPDKLNQVQLTMKFWQKEANMPSCFQIMLQPLRLLINKIVLQMTSPCTCSTTYPQTPQLTSLPRPYLFLLTYLLIP